jgi:hypothetical protein
LNFSADLDTSEAGLNPKDLLYIPIGFDTCGKEAATAEFWRTSSKFFETGCG